MSSGSIKSETSPVILIAIVILGLIGGYFYYSQVSQGNETPVVSPPVTDQDTLTKFKDTRLNFAVFDNAAFKSLQVIGEAPVQAGSTGRTDIFSQ